jgi:hypothetical protein
MSRGDGRRRGLWLLVRPSLFRCRAGLVQRQQRGEGVLGADAGGLPVGGGGVSQAAVQRVDARALGPCRAR